MNISALPNAQSVVVHDNLEDMSSAVARRIADLAAEAITRRGVFHVALAGGETPRRCYQKLRGLVINWKQVHIYFGDERCLPDSDAGRNDTMVGETLVNQVAIPRANIHPIPAELGAIEAASLYASLLARILPLDLALLGMGEDGHTASLFPDNPACKNTASVVPVFNAPKPPLERVSLGLNTLKAARQKIFLVAGSGKRPALLAILKGADLPAAQVTAAEWHFDQAAVSED